MLSAPPTSVTVSIDVYSVTSPSEDKPPRPTLMPTPNPAEDDTRLHTVRIVTPFQQASWVQVGNDRFGTSAFYTRKGVRVAYTIEQAGERFQDTVTIPAGQTMRVEALRKDGARLLFFIAAFTA